jgi:FkbM family methyltransferase
MKIVKKIIKRLIHLLGYDLVKYSHSKNGFLINWFRNRSGLLIFDVGAHYGESALNYMDLFNDVVVYSFEPSLNAFQELSKIKKTNLKSFNLGLSNIEGEDNFHFNESDSTNSLLKLSKNAAQNWDLPTLKSVGQENLKFTTLDRFLELNNLKKIDFLKLDVQGAEFMVLNGALETLRLKRIELIQIEYINIETYENAKSLDYYLDFLNQFDYKLISIFEISYSLEGKLLQFDMFFSPFNSHLL